MSIAVPCTCAILYTRARYAQLRVSMDYQVSSRKARGRTIYIEQDSGLELELEVWLGPHTKLLNRAVWFHPAKYIYPCVHIYWMHYPEA